MSIFRKYFLKGVVIFLIAFAGFFRDFLFVNINYKITALYYKNSNYELPAALNFLNGCSYTTLYYLKYFFTAVSILLFFALSLLTVKIFFNQKSYLKWIFLSYIIIILVSGILFGIIYLFTDFNTAYFPTRKILELVESPLLIMIFLPVLLLKEKTEK